MLLNLTYLYSLSLSLIICLVGLFSARSPLQGAIACLFIPVVIYYARRLLTRLPQTTTSAHPNRPHSTTKSPTENGVVVAEELEPHQVNDVNRRLFLKLIGSSGLAALVFALFKRDASAAFFGSVPGPGTVGLKDIAGNKINPAEKHPTDGYEVSQVDDSNIPSYFGFVNKNGAWYIAREGNNGEYRYIRGSGLFSASWAIRTSLTYTTFDVAFANA